MADSDSTARRSLSVRTRFEVFKRDEFQCRYCGQRSPEVVLEVDHVVPLCEGGNDDPLNLVTSCWSCNRGKAGVPLNAVMPGEDPVERAMLIAERDHQIAEYNAVLKADRERRESQAQEIVHLFCDLTNYEYMRLNDWQWVVRELERTPLEIIREKLYAAARSSAPKRAWMIYVKACVRRWREDGF